MTQEFIPLTEDQLIAAEKGELKLKCRNGKKIERFMWEKLPYDQSRNDVLTSISANDTFLHYKDGKFCRGSESGNDLFVDEEETAKLK